MKRKYRERIKAWVCRFVPHHVNDKVLLTMLSILSWAGLSSGKIRTHLSGNSLAWNRYQTAHKEDAYLEHQNDMKDIQYGNHSADYNACEVIAVYNALIALHGGIAPFSFPELLAAFEKRGITAGGAFGTSPRALCRYFKASGYLAQMISGHKINDKAIENMQKNSDTFLMTAYNDADNLGEMIHTVSITEKNGSYIVHNAGDGTVYPSLTAAVRAYRGGRGRAISLIGVKRC
jgi:hypothetical protein